MFTELIREFLDNPELGVSPVVGPFVHRNDYLDELGLRGVRMVRTGPWERHRLLAEINRVVGARSRGGADLVHRTYYSPLGRSDQGAPVVTTVLDMIPEQFPDQVRQGAHEHKLELVAASDLVVCISESVRNDLLSVVGSVRPPVVVCPLGTRFRDDSTAPPRDAGSLAYVGARGGYKQFDVLLRALAATPLPPVTVVCAGGGPFTMSERELIACLPPHIAVVQQTASDAELQRLYGTATALVSCSAAEGFGLPVLEAMAHGCPVIVSDIAVYREVAGDAGSYFTVGDEYQLSQKLQEVLAGGADTAQRGQTGIERANNYSWSNSAALLAEAYRSIM